MAKKRANDEGAIFKRPNGKWQAQITLEGKRISKTFSSKKECRLWNRDMTMQKERGLSFIATKTSFQDYLIQWLEDIKQSLRPTTWSQYQGVVNNHIVPILGKIKLASLSSRNIQNLYTISLNEGKGERTVVVMHAVIHRSLKMAKRQGLISINPASSVQKPKYESRIILVLDESQIHQLLSYAKTRELDVLIRLAVTTGMRLGEVLGLKWKDVDWPTPCIQVRRQLQRVKGMGLIFSKPKTDSGIRTILIGDRMLSLLGGHLDNQDLLRRKLGPRWRDNDLIFPSGVGTPKEPRNLIREFKALLVQANLPNFRFHDLRHTAASLMLMSNMPLIRITRQLGHAKPSTTLDIYGHLIPGLESDSVEKIDYIVEPVAAELQQIIKKDSEKLKYPRLKG